MDHWITGSLHQCISASLHQCISASVHQCTNGSVDQCINVSISKHRRNKYEVLLHKKCIYVIMYTGKNKCICMMIQYHVLSYVKAPNGAR